MYMKTKMAEKKTGIADWLRDRVYETPDKTAVIDPLKAMTFKQLAEEAGCVSTFVRGINYSLCVEESDSNFQNAVRNSSNELMKKAIAVYQSRKEVAGQVSHDEIYPVGIFMEKSCDAVTALLGVVLSGNYYCMLDTGLPAERLLQLTKALKSSDGSSCKLILTDATNLEKAQIVFRDTDVQVIEVESDILLCKKCNYEKSAYKNFYQTPLYCSFTSGSTGIPKGVLISHQNVMDFIPVFDETLSITGEDILACQAPFDFDISVKDIYTCLYKGATLVLVPRSYFVNPTLLMDYLEENKVTTLIWAVSALVFLSVMKAPSYKKLPLVKQIIYSGEVMPMQHLRYLHENFPQARFVNVYGPTEITCNCTYHVLDEADFKKDEVPIGRPFDGRRVFLLDDEDNVVENVVDTIEKNSNQTNRDVKTEKKEKAEKVEKAEKADMKDVYTEDTPDRYGCKNANAEEKSRIGEICVAGVGLALGYLEEGIPALLFSTDNYWQSIAEISSSFETRKYESDREACAELDLRDNESNSCTNTDGGHVGNRDTFKGFQYYLTPEGYIERIYHTGDLGAYDENGELLYRGRADLQIKMRGHRIELTEIEHYANQAAGVIRSCCLFDETKERLILCIEGTAREAELRAYLQANLPAVLVPKKIICLEKMPMNRHGKIDRQAVQKNVIEQKFQTVNCNSYSS